MKTKKLHPIIFIKTTQDVFLKQISDFEDLQLFFRENKISDYTFLKIGNQIEINSIIYNVKNVRFCLITSENLSYDNEPYNFCIDIMVE